MEDCTAGNMTAASVRLTAILTGAGTLGPPKKGAMKTTGRMRATTNAPTAMY